MEREAGEARKATAEARPSDGARGRSGIARCSALRSFGLSSEMLANSGVSAGAGQTTFAVIPARARSRARVLVKATIPPLHAEYTASPLEPTRAASEAMFTTVPWPCSVITRTTDWLQCRVP